MRILGIETSCDETAVAVVDGKGERVRLLSSFVRSQIDVHAEYGGVVPEVAAREHLATILPMLRRIAPHDGAGIDAVAVTVGPGLAPALRVGVETAKALAYAWGKPFIPVCHLEGHIYASWLGYESTKGTKLQKYETDSVIPNASEESTWKRQEVKGVPVFPAIALIVSGGHTELVLMKGHGDFERLGETLDDAAGEAFDKVAKMLGLGYPGGPKVADLAASGKRDAFAFPRGLKDRNDFAFSFSGLKTSVLYTLRANEEKLSDNHFKADIAASFEEAVVDVLVHKTMRAVTTFLPKSVILAGGVAANIALRERLKRACEEASVPLFVPDFALSVDNAAMIAAAGYFRARRGDFADPLTVAANSSLDIA